MLLQTQGKFKRPTYCYTTTFSNGASVTCTVRPGIEVPQELEVELTEAKPKFSPVEVEREYEPWRKACLNHASRQIFEDQRLREGQYR